MTPAETASLPPEPTPTTPAETASAAPKPTQAPKPPEKVGAVPIRFVGTWTGPVTQSGSNAGQYPVKMTVTGGELGEQVGTVEYLTLDCSGHLELSEASPYRLSVTEVITEGRFNCSETVVLFLTYQSNGKLTYGFKTDDARGTATLTKSGS
jgi:hypothetical protein